MIRLYDWFSQETADLDTSLNLAGIKGDSVVINDDGFLPETISSPYSFFCRLENEQKGRPLFFNQISVPEFWQITGNNSKGEVWNLSNQMADIYYIEPKHKRFVKNVDWYDNNKKIRFTDHYNKYGWLFARTNFDFEQRATVKTYYNQLGQEIVVENFQTGDVILNWQGKVHFFENKNAFIRFYFDYAGLDASKIWYNSLSTPFFISYYYNKAGSDILFWQEDIGDAIPGNMLTLLNNSKARTQRIIVQKKVVYDKILSLLPEHLHHKISYLGYIYPEKRQNTNTSQVLILTNSDNILHLDTIVNGLQDFTFHIGALTEMSQKLNQFENYPNVRLYPNISPKMIDHLFNTSDIYLDINFGGEIVNATRLAYEHNLLVLAFSNTVHNLHFISPEFVIDSENPLSMINLLKNYKGKLTDLVKKERLDTANENIDSYLSVLKEEL